MLHFMYQGEVNIKQEDIASFLKVAEVLQIKGLTKNNDEVCTKLTATGSSINLSHKCKKIIINNFLGILRQRCRNLGAFNQR